MKKLIGLVILFLFTGIIFMGCKESNKEELLDKNIKKEDIDNTDNENIVVEERDEIQEFIKSMTLDEKIGQLLIVGFEGTSADENIISLIQDRHIGGIIFFGSNVDNLNGVINLTNELKDLNSGNKVPLFISVDEEGGYVSRTPYEFTKIPTASYIGSFNDESLAYNVGNLLADELKVQGYNMDFAPVLDILSNPYNTVIGDRALGGSSEVVSKLGISEIKGIRDNGIISVAKHFPGHGDTMVDSHYGLPLVEKSLEELKELEFIPFENAIGAGVDAIMVSHILLSQIDSENPASMSKAAVTDILRNDMSFDGVIFSDDMTMGAIIENYDIGEAAIKSINAGVDVLLVCHGYDNELQVINSIREAAANNIISEERINESVYRVLKLKEKYSLSDSSIEFPSDINDINERINSLYN